MKRDKIAFGDFTCDVFSLLKDRWLLLTAGEKERGKFNMMTIAWAAFGVMWEKPFALVVVRPSRYTYEYMEKGGDFTLCALPEDCRSKLLLCGTKSGRDIDKVAESGFTVIPSTSVRSPAFDQAELIVECRKIYHDDYKPANFMAAYIEKAYGGRDYHRMYFGEIVAIHGTAFYSRGTHGGRAGS